MRQEFEAIAAEKQCRLTTRGRRSGQPRSVTIWFVVDGDAIAVGSLKNNRNWIRNALANPEVELEIGGRRLTGRLRATNAPEHSRIRAAMARKYLVFRIASWFGFGQNFTYRVEGVRPA